MADDSRLVPDYEHGIPSELNPLIPTQHNVKILSKKEAYTARAQFLALCWSLFLIGWTDGSTGPLLPRIQKFYDVSQPIPFHAICSQFTGWLRDSVLDFCFGMYC